ncbi:MAG: D-alanyl-D-alanine carboxypeptidase family protein [Clostridia bacterium]
MPKKALFCWVVSFAALLTGAAALGSACILPATARVYTRTRGYPEIVYAPYYTEGPWVTAASAVLIESTTGTVLYGKNENVRMHPASTTKIMTAILAIELGDMDSEVVVSANAAGTPGSSLWLRKGQRLRLDDLVRGTMLRSGNDGCMAIAEHIAGSVPSFVRMMNVKAQKIGALRTRFANPHGLTAPNHYSTAFDLALMARYGLQYPLFADIVSTREAEIDVDHGEEMERRRLANTNALLWSFEGADGVKTGTTAAAGYCLVASATRGGVQFISVVLDSASRWADSAKLLDYGFNRHNVVTFASRGQVVTTTRVEGGLEREIHLAAAEDLRVVVRKDLAHLIEERIFIDGVPRAPIRRGETLGRLAVLFDKDEMASVDLVAAEGMPRGSIPRVFLQNLKDVIRRAGAAFRSGDADTKQR